MGFPPDVTLNSEPSAFMSAYRGWRLANGHDDGSEIFEQLEELDTLMERYPDG